MPCLVVGARPCRAVSPANFTRATLQRCQTGRVSLGSLCNLDHYHHRYYCILRDGTRTSLQRVAKPGAVICGTHKTWIWMLACWCNSYGPTHKRIGLVLFWGRQGPSLPLWRFFGVYCLGSSENSTFTASITMGPTKSAISATHLPLIRRTLEGKLAAQRPVGSPCPARPIIQTIHAAGTWAASEAWGFSFSMGRRTLDFVCIRPGLHSANCMEQQWSAVNSCQVNVAA